MSNNFPVISVIMPVYNAGRFLETALKSISQQTFGNYELIIIDDGSTDCSLDVIGEFSKHDDRIRVLVNKKNLGIIASLNYGLENARGKYIARMDADDISLPTRFSRQIAFLDKNIEVGLLGTSYCSMRDDGRVTNSYYLPESDIYIRWMMLWKCPFCHSSIMFRREILEKVGGYDPKMKHAEDYALWSKMLTYTKGANLLELLVNYRNSDSQISKVKKNEQLLTSNLISAANINALMGHDGYVSVEEAAGLRSWYIPSDKSIIPPDSEKIIQKLIEIYYQFREKYHNDPGISNYVVFMILNVLKRAPLPFQIKIKFIFLAAKINLFQSLKTMIGFIIRGSDKSISDQMG